jgi:hypothetical protein
MMEKIDVIGKDILIYDENFKLINSLNLDTLDGLDLTYLDGCKMLTFNLTQPIKRVIKFFELNALEATAEFGEFIYSEMTEQQKTDFDNFILLIESLI